MPKRAVVPGGSLFGPILRTPPGLENQYVEFEMAVALIKDVNRATASTPLLAAAGAVLAALTEHGMREAIDTLHRQEALRDVPTRFPTLWETTSTRGAVREIGVLVVEPRKRETLYPLYLWCVLAHPNVGLRIRRCLECREFFFDFTRNRSAVYCSRRCLSRVTSRDYRAAGGERDRRAEKRKSCVTTKPRTSRQR